MKEFSIKALAQIINAQPSNDVDSTFSGVSTDSRTIQRGECFFAISGENFDGHDYVADAFARGAACAVVSRDEFSSADCALKVNDTVQALGDFAREYRRQMDFNVVAITGSVGKTTTRQMAHHVLSHRFHVFQAPKNFNNNIGLPLTLLDADPQNQIVIAEIGSNCPGEIAYLTRIARPDIAVITNVHPAHLAGLRDLQTIVQEKISISEGLQPDGILIINGDFEHLVSTCRARGIRFVTFGKSDSSDIQVRNIAQTPSASGFTINGSQVTLALPGPGNIENALAAWAICSRFGLTADEFAHAIKTVPAVPMRTELLQIGTVTVLNDCYNANPASMKNALEILANIGSGQKGRLVFICGDMAELGQQTEILHNKLGLWVAQAKVQLLIAVGKFARLTAQAAKENAKHDLQTKFFEDARSVCNNLEKFIKDYDIILVKGSRSAKLEMVVDKLKELFS